MSSYKIGWNYNDYKFGDLKKSLDNKNHLGKVVWILNTKKPKIGDEFYAYCSEMPDYNNRFIMYGRVNNIFTLDEYKKEYYDVYKDSYLDSKWTYYEMTDLKYIESSDNEFKYSPKYILKNNPDLSFPYRSNCCVLPDYIKIDKKDLHDIDKMYNLFDISCDLCGCKSTFMLPNGTYYFEHHHFLYRSLLNSSKLSEYSKEELAKVIDSKYNLFSLCPACHRKIHLAKYRKNEVEKLMNKMYEDKNRKAIADEICKIVDCDDIDELVNDLYKLNN